MKKLLLILPIAGCILACSTLRPNLPKPSTETVINYIDSVTYHDSTIYHTLYKERYNDYTSLLDTLNMSTTYSDFSAWVDTTNNSLKGTAENKDIDVPVKIKWKEKIVYKDSIVTKEVPYPVEVTKEIVKYPKTYWWFMGISILSLAFVGFKLWLKNKIKI